MVSRRRRLLESPRGRGKVSRSGTEIAEVRYDLRIEQIVNVRQGMGSSDPVEVPGLEVVEGTLTILSGDEYLVNDNSYILHLEDGREWEFYALGERYPDTYLAKGASGERLSR